MCVHYMIKRKKLGRPVERREGGVIKWPGGPEESGVYDGNFRVEDANCLLGGKQRHREAWGCQASSFHLP